MLIPQEAKVTGAVLLLSKPVAVQRKDHECEGPGILRAVKVNLTLVVAGYPNWRL
jgi:hypothetical protein